MRIRSQMLPLVFAVLAGFAGGILSQQLMRPVQAAAGPGVVTTSDLRLVDARGKLLAELGPVKYPGAKAPQTQLVFFAPANYQTSLGSGGLYFGKGYGNENLGIGFSYGSSGKQSPSVFFWFNKKGRMGFMLDADKGGEPSAWMYDAKGNTIWSAPSPTPTP
jgi:hypothetical protein